MTNLDSIISKLETFAPPELAEEWDNSGWQVFLGNKNITKIMLALSPTEDVIESAVNKGCELLITHHPMFYTSLNHRNLQVYAAHTNLDFAPRGIAERLMKMFKLEKEETLSHIVNKVKENLNVKTIKLINPSNIQKIRKIGVMPGSGGSLIPSLKDIDLYITGDVKYHDAIEVKNFAVIDAGHFETERIILPVLRDLLKEFDVQVFIAEEKPPWEFV
ncbi:MAG: Nif3-like dinuclear metal center hexameric protein [Candidatus Melainabacteria bacterium GWF2_37_15]|nr:MAG: Nif3-like dinuclear metal center hexameric protein [Candidatus Melainabacteria bacterium GWF2_37_15]